MIVSQMPIIRLKEGEEKNMKMKSHKVLSIILVMAVVFTGINFSAVKTYAGTKSRYMKSYNKLDKKCKKKFTYSGSQYEMNKDSGEEYKLWDKELNKDYNKIKKALPNNKVKKLVASELKWIKKRDKTAKKAASGWKGGSGYTMIYNLSLTKQTKSRIKWLIKNYA